MDKVQHPTLTATMKPYHFKTLRARLTTLLISPVVLILLVAGITGFIYARNVLFDQWNQGVMFQLERATHEIDMRLARPVELMEMFSKSGVDMPDASLLEAIVRKLETLPGVVRTNVNWHFSATGTHDQENRRATMGKGRFMRFHRGAFTKISPPRMDSAIEEMTVSITMVLMDTYDTPVGNLEIVLKFDYLVADIAANVWWQNTMACIADRASGKIILSSGLMQAREKLGETGDPLEVKLLGEITRKSTGTILGPGIPPERVVGFHRLEIFPWSLVVFANGKTILAPIINFRNGFILGAAILILVVYGIIRLNVDRMSGTIRSLSKQSEMLAAGNYGDKIPVQSHDEIGRLADSFNTMVDGLKERDAIRNTFGLYVDPDFARALLNQPEAGRLGGKRQEVAILMADIRGFTPMAEQLSPEETIEVLNRYFSAIIPLVQKHGGIIVDFVGDAILVFFEPIDDSLSATAQCCVHCAFDMHEAMALLNRQMKSLDLPTLNMGIGVNSGPVVVGNIGSEKRKKYGIVGAAVNTTQRIQGQSDAGEVVVSETVVGMVTSQVRITRTFSTSLKGVPSPVHLYAIAPRHPNTTQKD
jgi:adenylate cyclase